MSSPFITSGALLQCSCGTARSCLAVSPVNDVVAGNLPVASIMDHVPMVNILPFGMCNSPANPAAHDTQPCLPVIPAPWVPGTPTILIGGFPALNTSCKLICARGGEISIDQPAQITVLVP